MYTRTKVFSWVQKEYVCGDLNLPYQEHEKKAISSNKENHAKVLNASSLIKLKHFFTCVILQLN